MATMINRGAELIRIKPSNSQHLEVSKNDDRSWSSQESLMLLK